MEGIFFTDGWTTGLFHRMKKQTKKARARRNGAIPSRQELIAAHERALKQMDKMTDEEGFQSLVEAGIITPEGKLTPRYGG